VRLLWFILAVSPNIMVVRIGFFLIRLFGQALTPHMGMTTMARYFDSIRGNALSIAGSGMSAGEIILPLLASALIALVGWRYAFLTISMATLFIFLPVTLFLLKLSTPSYLSSRAFGSESDRLGKHYGTRNQTPFHSTRKTNAECIRRIVQRQVQRLLSKPKLVRQYRRCANND
jgi:MFS family permease